MQRLVSQERYDRALEDCGRIVDDLEQVAKAYERLLLEEGIQLQDSIPELNHESPFERARSKMKSQLINVAVCGAFNSGKSFLISGLIRRLIWYKRSRREDSDFFDHDELDGYASFLPSSPEQTSSCPLAVIPRPGPEKRSRLEVMFEDTKVWEEKSDPYVSEEDIHRKMLTYVTEVDQWRGARPTTDLSRNVVQARLYVADMPLPAIIYDLPGIGGVGGEAYLKTVHEAVRRADCIVYVASAIGELSEAELDLLRFVEEVAEKNRCPVFFVLSQIDREPEWRRVLDKDNRFLNEYFKKDGKPNKGFIGSGFMPISPAVSAKARGLLAEGKITESEYEKAIEKSGMERFFLLLFGHLTSTSGPAHLREIVVQMHGLLKMVNLNIGSRLQAETSPLEDAQRDIRQHQQFSRVLVEKRKVLLSDLEDLGKSALLAAFATSDPDDLLAKLRTELVPMVQKSDVLKESVRHQFEQSKKEIKDRWLRRPKDGLETCWTEAWNDFQKQTLLLLQARLSEAVREASISSANLTGQTARENEFKGLEPDKADLTDAVSMVNNAWQTWLSVTGLAAGGVAVGSAAAAAALAPLGAFLLLAGAAGLGWSIWRSRQDRKRLRKQMIEHLNTYAYRTVEDLRTQARQFVEGYKGEVVKIVNRMIALEDEKCVTLENRLKTGDLKAHQVRVGLLRDLGVQCGQIEGKVQQFYKDLETFGAA